jgi:dTDP-4-dehydrorhamnose reductase
MSGPRVWITGAGGLIGNALAASAARWAPDVAAIPLTRADLDLENADAVARRFRADQPALVIHCAGLTRGPACEREPERARRLNVDLTARLAELTRDATLLFFSTDLVFDGTRGNYRETDEPGPLSVYSRSKVDGEREALRSERNIVVRTSLNYGTSPTRDRAFNEDMLKTARAGGVLRLFTDEFRSPIPVEATARATWELARAALGLRGVDRPAGVFHLGGAERLSRWEIGQLIARRHPELEGRLEASSLREHSGAPRPADTSMDCAKIRGWLEFDLPRFSDWMAGPTPSSF